MTDQEKNKFCAYMLDEYGWTMSASNELLPIYYSLHQSVTGMNKTGDELKQKVEESLGKIKAKQYQFNYSGSVKDWWIGKIKYLLIILLFLSALITGVYFFYRNYVEKQFYNEFFNVIQVQQNEYGESYFTIWNPHEKNTFSTGYELFKSKDGKYTGVKIFMNNK